MTATEAEALTPKPGPLPAVTEALERVGSDCRAAPPAHAGLDRDVARRERKDQDHISLEPDASGQGVRREAPARISLIAGGANSDLYYRGKDLAPGRGLRSAARSH